MEKTLEKLSFIETTVNLHEVRIAKIEEHVKGQNGMLEKLETRLQRFEVNSANAFSSLNKLLFTLMGGVIASLILLVIQIVVSNTGS